MVRRIKHCVIANIFSFTVAVVSLVAVLGVLWVTASWNAPWITLLFLVGVVFLLPLALSRLVNWAWAFLFSGAPTGFGDMASDDRGG